MHALNRITLQTPESVELEFTLAGIGNRALALGLDYTLLSLILSIFLVVLSYLSSQLIDLLSNLILDIRDLELWVIAIALLVIFGLYVSYFVGFEALWQGQTPGKRLTRIRVIREDGRSVRLPQTTLRALLRPVDDLLFLGTFLIILSPREKRLGDWVAGTVVIQEEAATSPQELIIAPEAHSLGQQLIKTTNFTKLTPDDFAVIRQYLQQRQRLTTKASTAISQQLAKDIKTLIASEADWADISPIVFLEAVYLAYQEQDI